MRGGVSSEERADALDDVVRALAVGDDVGERFAQFSHLGTSLPDDAPRRLGVGPDRRERLANLVRERSGQCRERRDPADVGQILPQVARLMLGPLAFRHVPDHGQDPVVAANRTHLVVASLAGDRHEVLEGSGLIPARDLLEQTREVGGELGREDLGHVPADEILRFGQEELPVFDVTV